MTTLRIFGVIFAILAAIYFFACFRANRIRRGDFVFALIFCSALGMVSLFPGGVTLLRDILALEHTQFSRLIAILIFSNVLLWFLLIDMRGRANKVRDQAEHLIRHIALTEFRGEFGERMAGAPIVVIIPAFNEDENIGAVLDEMPAAIDGHALVALVVDDGSTDETAARVRERGLTVVTSPVQRGGGAALRIGFHIARASGAGIAVTMDGDGQHLPAEIGNLVKPILEDRFDLVIGSRMLGEHEPDSRVRLVGIHLFNALIRFLTGVRISDCSNGFRAFKVAELVRLRLSQDQYHTPELIIEAAKLGLRLGEAPVTVKRRAGGKSKKGGNWKYGYRFALSILKSWWR